MKSAVRSPTFRPQAFGVTECLFIRRFRLKAGLRTDFPQERSSMLTKRDSLIALLTVCATLAIVTPGQTEKPVMGSSVFDWNAIEAQPTKVGSTRKFFQAPTATLDELECHVTTLNPGETPH